MALASLPWRRRQAAAAALARAAASVQRCPGLRRCGSGVADSAGAAAPETLASLRVVVAGSGFSGLSTAMHLARRGAQVAVVDPRPPLTATSQYSTECYRDFFTDPALVPFLTRSIDLMEELAGDENACAMNRRGYVFLSSSESGRRALEAFAETASSFGGGAVRTHHNGSAGYIRSPPRGWRHPDLVGFDIVYGSEAIRSVFPFVSEDATVMLHARRCGWMDAHGMGLAMLAAAKEGRGGGSTRLVQGIVAGFDRGPDGAVRAVRVLDGARAETALPCDAFVNAAGAWMPHLGRQLAPEAELPLANEVHAKVVLNDTLGVIPQDEAPFMVWRDSVTLDWAGEEEGLVELDDTAAGGVVNSASWTLPQPGGQHLRPAGNGRVLLLWEHLHRHIPVPEVPELPFPDFLEMYPQLCVAGLAAMVPGLARYGEGALGRGTTIDGGYYTVTPDGRPLVTRHGAPNAFVCGGMGTYGFMGAAAAGELAALHVLGAELPAYAAACEWPRKDVLAEKPVDLLDTSH